MPFQWLQKVRFKDCDPAGIVFFPRYFEMINDCIEAFFDEELQFPFETLHKTHAVPTAQIDTRFAAPGRHGELLAFSLAITRVGNTSLNYRLTCCCGQELRLETTATLVFVNADGRPEPWPDAIRQKLETCEEKAP